MHIEIRKIGTKRKYYLAYTYRIGKQVKKTRVYLGTDLTTGELETKKRTAEIRLRDIISASKHLSDPLKTILTEKELGEIKKLEKKVNPKVIHLSEEEWKTFTKAFTYNTNAIEGSSLESNEVGEILDRNKWPNKPKEDISETYGVSKAIDFIRKTKEHLSLQLILELHCIVFENSKHFAGKLRATGVEVVVADQYGSIIHRGAHSTKVRGLILELVGWYKKNKRKYPPIVLAAVVHNQFENIHPFQDGNGRVGRLLLNNILIKNRMPPLNIELKNRHEYYSALQAYEKGHDLRPTIELMLKEYRNLKRVLKRR